MTGRSIAVANRCAETITPGAPHKPLAGDACDQSLANLDKLGIAVRTGQHCAEPVMTHYGVTGMCRASFAMYNTLAEADALVAGVERAVKMLK